MNQKVPSSDSPSSSPPVLDPALVAQVVGKRMLVGLTYLSHDGTLVDRKQLHGVVEEINEDAGVVLRLSDGTTFRLPPDVRGVRKAPPGTYHLKSTGEDVVDPDFLYTWTITNPDPSSE